MRQFPLYLSIFLQLFALRVVMLQSGSCQGLKRLLDHTDIFKTRKCFSLSVSVCSGDSLKLVDLLNTCLLPAMTPKQKSFVKPRKTGCSEVFQNESCFHISIQFCSHLLQTLPLNTSTALLSVSPPNFLLPVQTSLAVFCCWKQVLCTPSVL